MDNLLDWAYELYPPKGRLDAAEVAKAEFHVENPSSY